MNSKPYKSFSLRKYCSGIDSNELSGFVESITLDKHLEIKTHNGDVLTLPFDSIDSVKYEIIVYDYKQLQGHISLCKCAPYLTYVLLSFNLNDCAILIRKLTGLIKIEEIRHKIIRDVAGYDEINKRMKWFNENNFDCLKLSNCIWKDSNSSKLISCNADDLILLECKFRELPELLKVKCLEITDCWISSREIDFSTLTNLSELRITSSFRDKSRNVKFKLPMSLETFECSHNILLEFPFNVDDCNDLKELRIVSYKCGLIPDSIIKLQNLSKLEISSSPLNDVPDQFFSLTNLTELTLNNCKLQVLPSGISKLTKLQKLQLDNNQISELPVEIYQLSTLRHFSIESNKLQKIDSNIDNLRILQYLLLSGNKKLSNIPEELGNLKNLLELHLNETDIQELPSSINKLGELRILTIKCSSLTKLPDSLSGLKRLKELYLCYNKINSLPADIGSLNFLEVLSVNGCPIKKLPNEICQLTSLKNLSSTTQLDELPTDIGKLTNLEHLSISGCAILPDNIGELESLKTFSISGEKLRELPQSIGNCQSLEEVYLNANLLTSLPIEFYKLIKLRTLDLSYNNFTELPDSIENLRSLSSLTIRHNRLSHLPKKIYRLKWLEELNVGYNELTELPETLFRINTLKVMTADHNKIRKFPTFLYPHDNIECIDLNNNQLTYIPKDIQIKNIKQLHLNHNKIKYFSLDFRKMVFLISLSINDNPIIELHENIFFKLKSLQMVYAENCGLKNGPIFSQNDINFICEPRKNGFKSFQLQPDLNAEFIFKDVQFERLETYDLNEVIIINDYLLLYMDQSLNPSIEIPLTNIQHIESSVTVKNMKPIGFVKITTVAASASIILSTVNLNNYELLMKDFRQSIPENLLTIEDSIIINSNEVGFVNCIEKEMNYKNLKFMSCSLTAEDCRSLNVSYIERLIFINCVFPKHFIIDSPSLNKLSFQRCQNVANGDLTKIANLHSLQLIDLKEINFVKCPSNIGSLKISMDPLFTNAGSAVDRILNDQHGTDTMTHIELNYGSHQVLPKKLLEFKNLKSLAMGYVSLTEDINSIFDFSQLVHLCLTNCLISNLENIGKFKNLKHLSLACNQIRDLPASLFDLKDLQVLDLSFNRINHIPPMIKNLKELRLLNLSNNDRVTKLPDSVCQLSQLEILIMEHGSLTCLPEQIGLMQSLKKLSVPFNSIKILPSTIGKLNSLKVLNCAHNLLSSLPSEIGELVGLEELNLSGCGINVLPITLYNLNSLKYFYCKTDLKELHEDLGNLRNLVILDIECSSNLPNSTILLHNLIKLTCTKITSLPDKGFEHLEDLREANFVNCKLEKVPESLFNMKNLIQLDLGYNKLKQIGKIGDCKLVVLSIRNNQLNQLPKTIENMKNLRKLFVNDNNLRGLPKEMLKLKHIRVIKIEGNDNIQLSRQLQDHRCFALDTNDE